MGDKRNYAALEWVIGEIGETLNDARQALEAFVEDPRDIARIRFCLTHIHQVHGSLQMVEFHGASLFAEEMEALAEAMMQGAVVNDKEAQEVLMRSLLQLPHYLEQVKAYHDDHPGIVLPLLNDIRAVRKQSYLSETNLFNPDLSSLDRVKGDRHSIFQDVNKLREVVKKLRGMYKYAAISVLQGVSVDENLNYIDKVFVRLEGIARGTAHYPLWQISAALSEALARDDIELSVAVRGLFRQLARELKILEENSPQAFDAPPKQSLLRNLLYYVARAEDGGTRVAKVKSDFGLDASLLGGEAGRGKMGMIPAPDPGAIRAVMEALEEELNTVKHLMNLVLSGQGGISDLEEMLPIVKRIGDTLAVLGIGDMRKLAMDQLGILENMVQSGVVSDAELIDVAGCIADLEHRLEAIGKGAGTRPDYANVDEREVQIDSAREAVINECRNGLDRVKEVIVEAMSSQWDPSCLPNAVNIIRDIEGGLNMVPLARPADILSRCGAYVGEVMTQAETTPVEELQFLAEAIASIDYFLERLSGAHGEELEEYLDLAEDSLVRLGYGLEAYSGRANTESEGPNAANDGDEEGDTVLSAVGEGVDVEDVLSIRDQAEEQPDINELSSGISADTSTEAYSTAIEPNPLPEDVDEEIIEIFIEEAGEVQATLAECVPQWSDTLDDKETLSVVRRGFHTLKGSGRMVGALDVGELAWSVEQMLNRVVDATVPLHKAHIRLVKQALEFLPSLVTAFEERQLNPDSARWSGLISKANLLEKGEIPSELDGIDAIEPVNEAEVLDAAPELTLADTSGGADGDEPLAQEAMPADLSGDDNSGAISEQDQEDQQLWEIFSSEANTHLAVVDEYIEVMERAAPLYSPPTDALQSALHTLKGSAHMAGVKPIAAIITPLEGLCKELRSYQINSNKDVIQLLTDAASYTREGLACIERREPVTLEQEDVFISRVAELSNTMLAPLVHFKGEAGDVESSRADPKLLSLFMSEQMSLLLDADQRIDDVWRHQPEALIAETPNMLRELHALSEASSQANLPLMQAIGDQLQTTYEAIEARQLATSDTLFDVLKQAHEALLDMVDQVAAGQNIAPISEDLHQALSQLLSETGEVAFDEFDAEAVDAEFVESESDTAVVAEPDDFESEPANTEAAEAEDLVDDSANDVFAEGMFSGAFSEEEITRAAGELGQGSPKPIEESDESVADPESVDSPIDSKSIDESTPEVEQPFEPMAAVEPPILPPADEENAEDDISEIDGDDFDPEILEIFLEEAAELIEELDESIHRWETDWQDTTASEEMKRALHTMKGGARLSGVTRLGDLTHEYESYLIASAEPSEKFFHDILEYQDTLLSAVRGVRNRVGGGEVEAVEAPAIITPPNAVPDTSAAPASVSSADVLPFTPPKEKAIPEADDIIVPNHGVQQGTAKRHGSQEMVKVPAELLEELVNLAGETSISRGRLEQQVSDLGYAVDEVDSTLRRLNEQLRRLDLETEAQVMFRREQMAQHEQFDPLEMDRYSQLQQLTRSLMESSSDLVDLRHTISNKLRDTETMLLQQQRINSSLQEGLMRSRMVPFSRLVPRLRRIVRQVSGELSKHVNFELDNVEGEMDRSVLERMVAPLEHMLRNAVDHGIESPEERQAASKPETGRILLSLAREGGDILLRLADDGRGVDLARVREKAIERGLMAEDAKLSDHDIMQFILQAGFSTAENVTQISGRGVGLDVVAAEIKQLGGSMVIESKANVGTQFVVRLPFTVSVNRALMVQLGKESYAIPLNTIEGIVRVSPFELEHYYTHEDARFEYAGENYQVKYLGSMVTEGMQIKLEGQLLPLPVILVRSGQMTMALQVDGLSGSREIVVKSLGPQFAAVQGLSGATVMGDGSVVVILDPHALVRKEMAQTGVNLTTIAPANIAQALPEPAHKTIMVVDDSVTVRKVTTRFLEREGFNVIIAKDGVDALQVLQEHTPDLMLLDIEMPRMDGFEVAKTMRSAQRWKSTPIIMITSRTGDKHRQHAMSIGVNDYMGKPYQEEGLLRSIQALLNKHTESA